LSKDDLIDVQGTVVAVRDAETVSDLTPYDAVILGGAVYAGRWHPAARRFARRHREALRHITVWLFSSGPLGEAAHEPELPPVPGAARIMRRVGALGHATFGGRLEPDADGLLAGAIAKRMGGDYRDRDKVHAWARQIGGELTTLAPP
jgi:menaquinone-dependent protoporphyrinogen oxidase